MISLQTQLAQPPSARDLGIQVTRWHNGFSNLALLGQRLSSFAFTLLTDAYKPYLLDGKSVLRVHSEAHLSSLAAICPQFYSLIKGANVIKKLLESPTIDKHFSTDTQIHTKMKNITQPNIVCIKMRIAIFHAC